MKKILILNFLFLFTLSQNSSSQTDNRSNITIENHHIVIETVDGELIVTDAVLKVVHFQRWVLLSLFKSRVSLSANCT